MLLKYTIDSRLKSKNYKFMIGHFLHLDILHQVPKYNT